MAIPQPLTGEEYRFAVAFTKAIAYLQTTAYTNRPNTAYKDLHPKIVTKTEEGQEPAYWNLLPGKNYEDAIILANPLPDTTESEEWCILPTEPRNGDKSYAQTLLHALGDQDKIDYAIIKGFHKREYDIMRELFRNDRHSYDRITRDILETNAWSSISRDYLAHAKDTMPINPDTTFYIPGQLGNILQEVTHVLQNLPYAVLKDHNGWNRRAMEIVDRIRAQMGIPVGLDDIPEEDFIFGDYTDALNVLKAADKREFEAKNRALKEASRASHRAALRAAAKQRSEVHRATEKAEEANEVVFDLKNNQRNRKPPRRNQPREVAAILATGGCIAAILSSPLVIAVIVAATQR